MKELAKQYDPSQVEDRIYQFWLDGGYFHTKADPDKKPYTIVMPPPNVTGQLHMGHAVDNTMQDILIRTKRMQGYAALYPLGADEHILHGVIQRMAHVELTGHVRRGHDDGVRLLVGVRFRVEVAAVLPELVDTVFHLAGIVLFCEFFHCILPKM